MWLNAMMLEALGANPPTRMMVAVVLGLLMIWAGVALFRKPESLARLLRRGKRLRDLRIYFAQDLEQSPWKAKMVGAAALLWGALFVVMGFNIVFNFIN